MIKYRYQVSSQKRSFRVVIRAGSPAANTTANPSLWLVLSLARDQDTGVRYKKVNRPKVGSTSAEKKKDLQKYFTAFFSIRHCTLPILVLCSSSSTSARPRPLPVVVHHTIINTLHWSSLSTARHRQLQIQLAVLTGFLLPGDILVLDRAAIHIGGCNETLQDWLWDNFRVFILLLPARCPE